MRELHLKEVENMPDGAEYFQKRYDQERELLEVARQNMDTYKAEYKKAAAARKKAVDRLCNLRQEIDEANSPIVKLSKSLSDDAWQQGEIDLLKDYGLAESIVDTLKAAGVATVGKLMENDDWRDIPGIGEATQEKVTQAAAELIDTVHKQVAELRKVRDEEDNESE
jgi:hypothetical protein